MFYIVESEEQLEFLEKFKEVYVQLIKSRDDLHPLLSFPVAVYIRPLLGVKGYMLPLHHPEGLNISETRVSQLLSQFEHVYVWDKKECGSFGEMRGYKDLSLLHTLQNTEKLDISSKNNSYHQFYRKFDNYLNINQLIPLSKLYEYGEEMYEKVKHLIEEVEPGGYPFFNDIAVPVFFLIEQSGVGVEEREFINRFSPRNPELSLRGGKVYTQYNLGNFTTRPTNTFNKVNFTAIPKTSEYRRCFRPQNDVFVEMDFSGYHLRLIGREIGYDFGEESPHIHLSKKIYNKEDITQEEYNRVKQHNFQFIFS